MIIEWGVLERTVWKRCPKGMKGGGIVLHDSFMAVISSGMGRASGLCCPVGCRDIASAALCLIPGIWTI